MKFFNLFFIIILFLSMNNIYANNIFDGKYLGLTLSSFKNGVFSIQCGYSKTFSLIDWPIYLGIESDVILKTKTIKTSKGIESLQKLNYTKYVLRTNLRKKLSKKNKINTLLKTINRKNNLLFIKQNMPKLQKLNKNIKKNTEKLLVNINYQKNNLEMQIYNLNKEKKSIISKMNSFSKNILTIIGIPLLQNKSIAYINIGLQLQKIFLINNKNQTYYNTSFGLGILSKIKYKLQLSGEYTYYYKNKKSYYNPLRSHLKITLKYRF